MYKEITIASCEFEKHSKVTLTSTVGRVYQKICLTHPLEMGEEVLNIVLYSVYIPILT